VLPKRHLTAAHSHPLRVTTISTFHPGFASLTSTVARALPGATHAGENRHSFHTPGT